jgi:hypothetical protein
MKNEKSRNIAYLQLPLDKGLAQYKSVTMAYRSPKGVSVALLKNGTVTEGKILPEDAGEVERITLNGRQAKLYDLDDDADVRRIEFFKKFPGVRIDGDEESNPNYKGNAHCLDLIIPKQKASANILNNKVVSQLQLIIHNLDNNSRYNLAYPMGLPVQEMSSEEI